MNLTNEINVSGNSGCRVTVSNHGQELVIIKSTEDTAYIPRLKAQIAKQKLFRESSPKGLYVPKIIDETETPESYLARMEYLPYLDFIDFYGKCSIPAIKSSLTLINNFFQTNLSNNDIVANPEILDKISQIAKSSESKQYSARFSHYLERTYSIASKKEIRIPRGRCHGDLTLSNILFSGDGLNIGLIDFLDSYLESPVMDLIKLRQDTQFGWSFLKTTKFFLRPRLTQILSYLDKKIENELLRYIGLTEYRILQSVNILRILPYAQDNTTLDFIETTLSRLEA